LEKSKFEVPSWDYVYTLLIDLCEKIKKSRFTPDIIVGVSRWGWHPTRVISDLLENPNIANIKVEFYADIFKTGSKPIITQPISMPIKDKTILIVDDVSDTGKTLELVTRELAKQVKEIKTVTLYCKPWTCFKPDFFARSTECWIIFPWDRFEMIKSIGREMMKEGKSVSEVVEKLIKIGLDPVIVKKFTEEIFGQESL
jgi:hypoxanthine phosphoribosyltransferase